MATNTNTKHSADCTRVFGRYDATCPRCQELARGARPREWSSTRRARLDAQHARECREHNCKLAGCGPVCTFGDW